MNFFKTLRKDYLLIALAGLIIGGPVGYAMSSKAHQNQAKELLGQVKSVRENNKDYQFINPLLAYDLPETKDLNQFTPLKDKIQKVIDSNIDSGNADNISMYFRSGGHWVGINEDDQYDPASLMKVVTMIAYYKQADTDTAILAKQLKYSNDVQSLISDSSFKSQSKLHLGQLYSVSDLIDSMIRDSDNGAALTLLAAMDPSYLDEVFSDLGLPVPTADSEYRISPKAYSLFFRVLFNSTYLSRTRSEQSLALLAQAYYKDGLVAGVPVGTKVAHKFGEYILTENGRPAEVELHDCGLIYGPPKTYYLCVMTKGQNIQKLQEIIKEISNVAYETIK
jgi:hypothetical protein